VAEANLQSEDGGGKGDGKKRAKQRDISTVYGFIHK
jgi:hypothetical protein